MALQFFTALKSISNVYFGTLKADNYEGTDNNDLAFGLWGNDVLSGGKGNDILIGGFGHDHVYGGAGNDKLYGGFGNDYLYGGSGSDYLSGGCGNDKLYGDGPAELVKTSFNFQTQSWLPSIASDGTHLDLTGLTVSAIGGNLSQFQGLSVTSPHDVADTANGKGWVKEIDAWNDTQEGVRLDFGTAQSEVTITIAQLYKEKIYSPVLETEQVDILVHFTDGTTGASTALATATAFPGDVTVTFNAASTGGKQFDSIVLVPDLFQPHDVPAQFQNDVNAHSVVTEFTLKSVAYSYDLNQYGPNDDCLDGGSGNDYLNGGYGNDTLNGGSGCDILTGGAGRDTFVFDCDTDKATVTDFMVGQDHAKFSDAVKKLTTIDTNGDGVKDATQISLVHGGSVTFEHVVVTDWHMLA